MKKTTAMILSLALLALLLAGCGGAESTGQTDGDAAGAETQNTSTEPMDTAASQTDEAMFTQGDTNAGYDESAAVHIQLNGTSAAADSDSVTISGTTVTLTGEGTYIVSGTLEDGTIVIDAPKTAKLRLVLNGAEVNSESSAPLYILSADKVFLTLAAGTENTLSNGGSFIAVDETNIDGALFSKQDLTLNGSGSLTVTSPAGHGIVCKDDLVLTGGTYIVTCAGHGLDANDSVRITGETGLTIDAGKDGIHCENADDPTLGFVYISAGTMDIEAEGDGISAGSYAQIGGGTFDLLAGGGSGNGTKASSDSYGGFMGGGPGGRRPGGPENTAAETDESSTSMKGIKAESGILISGGTFRIDSADDSVHSNESVTINGGVFEIASGDDAIHGEDTLTITAGTINISESYEGLEALHVDVQGGEIALIARDDGLNAAGGADGSGTSGGRDGMMGGMGSSSNGSITISGGTLYVNASGDGLDANGTITISGGYTVVVGPTQGDTATLDYDRSAVITGGTFIGTGASGMAQSFSESGQGVVALSVGSRSAGTEITLKDSAGNTILSYAPELPFSVVIFSSADVKAGETYSITVGSDSGEFEAY